MLKADELIAGEVFNGYALVDYVPDNLKGERMGVYECLLCKKSFTTRVARFSGKFPHLCGCRSKHPLYGRWSDIKKRCFNPNCDSYCDYGGRGITICDEWNTDFYEFVNHLSSLPNALKEGYSIDRVNNDGNYEPGNVRWADRHTQATNTRMQSGSKSGYVGVYPSQRWGNRLRWYGQVVSKGKTYESKHYDTLEEALDYRNNLLKDLGEFYRIQPLKESDRCANN